MVATGLMDVRSKARGLGPDGVNVYDMRAWRRTRNATGVTLSDIRQRAVVWRASSRLVVRELVLVDLQRHQTRREPHGAQRRNHRDIHDDPHGPTPGSTTPRTPA